jgi:hypothetical protein
LRLAGSAEAQRAVSATLFEATYFAGLRKAGLGET